MTTPDHRPYLTDTDLRTPEDVLAWLWDRARSPASDGFACRMVANSATALEVRLDRERRQACRRAALAEWRKFAYDLRRNSGHNAWVCKWCIGHIARVLAFRAAARTP